ncbi:hypothetical protein [Peribacillus sp. Hz7]|uniref:hypothetical protein n=1 Tax=Peribacillus sp. Hz7 TaxID=3344873 RepID=UPI0035CC953F
MNDKLMEFLLRDEVSKLTDEKRKVYQFIVKEEDLLAEKAETADQLLQLLTKHSPYRLAARHFNMSVEEITRFMQEIEAEISERMEVRYKKVKWIDYTKKVKQSNARDSKKHLYLFIN